MTLAYLFWHWPADPAAHAAYEERMRAFHAALELPGSRTLRLARAPHDPTPGAYEDWYPVAGWAELGELNERAVSGARRVPHDAAAVRAGQGAGGVYALLQGTPDAPIAQAHWLAKPAGAPYATFVAELRAAAPEAAIWQRQMVLGPAPEFAVLAPAGELTLPWPSTTTGPQPI